MTKPTNHNDKIANGSSPNWSNSYLTSTANPGPSESNTSTCEIPVASLSSVMSSSIYRSAAELPTTHMSCWLARCHPFFCVCVGHRCRTLGTRQDHDDLLGIESQFFLSFLLSIHHSFRPRSLANCLSIPSLKQYILL